MKRGKTGRQVVPIIRAMEKKIAALKKSCNAICPGAFEEVERERKEKAEQDARRQRERREENQRLTNRIAELSGEGAPEGFEYVTWDCHTLTVEEVLAHQNQYYGDLYEFKVTPGCYTNEEYYHYDHTAVRVEPGIVWVENGWTVYRRRIPDGVKLHRCPACHGRGYVKPEANGTVKKTYRR